MKKSLLFLSSLLFSLFVPLVSAHTITVPTSVYFGTPLYGTYINFSTEQTFDDVYRESNYWYFDGYGFQVQNANMTISQFFESDRLIFTVDAAFGTTSTAKVYCGDKGEPLAIYTANGTLTWSYNAFTTILTMDVTHASPTRIMVYWKFLGDFDSDSDVDANDLYQIARAYGSVLGDPTYNSNADIDGDDDVDSNDLYIFAENYGKIRL